MYKYTSDNLEPPLHVSTHNHCNIVISKVVTWCCRIEVSIICDSLVLVICTIEIIDFQYYSQYLLQGQPDRYCLQIAEDDGDVDTDFPGTTLHEHRP